MVNLIGILVVILVLGAIVGFAQLETLLSRIDDKVDNLSENLEEFEKTLEENKPEKLYKVKLKYYEDGEVKIKTLTNITNVDDELHTNSWVIYKSNKIIFTKKEGQFVLDKEDVINYDFELM